MEQYKMNEGLSEEEILSIIQKLTNDWTKKDGYVETSYEDEKDIAKRVLKNHYEVVEVSDGRRSENEPMSYVIAYSNPIENEESKKSIMEIEEKISKIYPEAYLYSSKEMSTGTLLRFYGFKDADDKVIKKVEDYVKSLGNAEIKWKSTYNGFNPDKGMYIYIEN